MKEKIELERKCYTYNRRTKENRKLYRIPAISAVGDIADTVRAMVAVEHLIRYTSDDFDSHYLL